MSGHSKWAQIKHKKALTDAKRGKVFSKILRMITVAAKEKGPDPAANSKLRNAIEKGRSLGLPSENIERAIKKASGAGTSENLEEVVYEAFGPSGTAMLISGITDSRNRTTAEIKHLLSENGGRLADKGSVEWTFKKMAAFDIAVAEGKEEEAELKLIDAGAEDVIKNDSILTARVSPGSAESFRKNLQDAGSKIEEEYFDYVPQNKIEIKNEGVRQKLAELLEALDNNDDVQEIYTNFDL